MTLIDGKQTAREIKEEIRREVQAIVKAGERPPCLAAVLVGDDGGSQSYVASKVKACADCGFISREIRMDSSITQDELLAVVRSLNDDPEVDGFIIQLPLPKHIDEQTIIRAVSPEKDVDGFHPENVGRLSIGLDGFVSATPAGIMELLRRYNIATRGKRVVIVGRSNIVGKPLAMLMMQKGADATVTVCHSATANLPEVTRQADILVAALGRPGFVTADMVRDGAVVIDVGTTRVDDPTRERGWRLQGDVDFDAVAPKCSMITPVPGGVGPMTICSLMLNTLKARKRRR